MEREETPVHIEREFRMGKVIAGLIVRHEAFRSARGPAYGPAQASRRPGDNPLLRIGFALVAEAAAHVRRDDAQRALGNAELLGDLATDVMRSLRGGVERELVALRLGQHRARFDRRADQTVVDEIDGNNVSGAAEGCPHGRLVAARPAKANVAGSARVQLRRGRCLRRARIGDGGERRVVHLDTLGGVERLREGFGDDRRDRLSDVAHLFARQGKARRLGHGRPLARADHPQRPHRGHAVGRHVGAGKHRDDAGRAERGRYVDPANVRMRVRRANKGAGERAGEIDIGDEPSAAGQKTPVLDAAQRNADALIVVHARCIVLFARMGVARYCRVPDSNHALSSTPFPPAPDRAARTPTCPSP